MDFDFESEDNEVDALHGVSYQQLPSAPPSTPNSNISSPPVGNEDAFQSQLFPHNVMDNGDNFLSGMDSKLHYSKRGPGRPRKDIVPVKGIQKRKTIKDAPQSVGPLTIALSSSENSNTGFSDDKPSQTVDEPHYVEKHPGKLCCLCNLGERSALGQGDFIKWKTEPDNCELAMQFYNEKEKSRSNESLKNTISEQTVFRRQKSYCKNKSVNDSYNELDKIGQIDLLSLQTLLDGGYLYLHRMCLMWSQGVNGKISELKMGIELIVAKGLTSKCSFCGQYGASVTCKMSCKKMFHLPCAAASGSFLIMENFSLFCNDHMEQVQLICPDINISCHHCSTVEKISKLIMCAACGEHFHTDCVGLMDTAETRAGWNCSNCSKCQICREGDGVEGRFIKCEQCQRLYHTMCLRPIISSLPKYGWKCNRCRVCTDCGSRTPGGGTSSRWHHHYTICDSCYQQRNKGFSCPICHKAYRAAAYKEMVKCSLCHRFVHSTCDEDADLANYHKKKEANPDYDYVCPQCKLMQLNDKFPNNAGQLRCTMEATDPLAQTLEDGLLKEMDIDSFQKENGEFSSLDFQSSKMFKRKILFKDFQRNRGGKMIVSKSNVLSHFGRKRGSVRGKGRQLILNSANTATSSDRANSRTSDDGLSNERKILLCSAKDKFILSQDICVMCGSVGYDKESHLIACAQCGQCYHPYCANTKLSKVILDRGWRCLDCTVCERCGQRNDEARLILCDECDLSYHIYCTNPPLDTVPHGNWKCKWCAACQKCGRYSQGMHVQSRNNMLECGPCASQVLCCVCNQQYMENELIIQCKNCERWLHCRCDSIKSEEEAQICDNIDYHCVLCRPKDKSLSQFLALKDNTNSSKSMNGTAALHNKTGAGSESNSNLATLSEQNDSEVTYWVDGVCMSERGANMIKALSTEIKRKRKMRAPNDSQTKESGIMAAIESVVSGSNENNRHANDEGGDTGDGLKKKDDNYKDGMIWMGGDSSPPEGFSISTNDEGISILRKKRQRNLQKLGIGGFSVRNRAFKKDSEENALIANNTSVFESEKKKKVMRKKVKSRLSEAYPIYLQEAFFGKILLDTKSQNLSADDSEASDELMDVSDALFHEEKGVEKPPSPSNNLKDSKEVKPNETMAVTEVQAYKDKTINLVPSVEQSTVNASQDMDKNQKENIIMGSDVTKSANIPIQHTFIDTKYKEINSDGIVATAQFITDVPKETLYNIANIPKEKVIAEEHGRTILKQPAELHTNNQTDFRTVPVLSQTTPDAHLLLKNSPQNHTQGNVSYIVQQPQPQQAAQNQEQTSQIQILPMQLQTLNSEHVVEGSIAEKPIIQQNTFAQMQKPRVPTACTLSPYITPATPQPADSVEAIVAGTQKTAEKMRRDEDLGEMATISAVLYANTQHPELKQIYPNWNDRCKQILKRWRSLSNEKKAPFLQQAKDNRSALRMRKSQQDQERICFNQKTLKEQEQERIWKQHQAKAKEAQTTLYSHRSTSFDGNIITEGCAIEKRAVVYNTDVIQRAPQTHFAPRDVTEQSNIMPENNDNSTDNKHLRTLLLKQQGHETPWMPTATRSGFFQQPMSYEFKSNIQQQNTPKINVFHCNENKTQIKEIPKQQGPMLNTLEMVQLEQTDGNENKQNFKQRKEIKTSDTGESELEKLDSDENGAFGDILGGLGDGNDDDLLKSLTAEIGDDFNILEYADPALDELASNQNLLNKLDFEYNDKNTV